MKGQYLPERSVGYGSRQRLPEHLLLSIRQSLLRSVMFFALLFVLDVLAVHL